MQITKLTLEDFRNYKQFSTELDPRLNVITGENAQGKTNLIEAIGYVCYGRSFRSYKDAPLIRLGQSAAYITAEGISNNRDMTIEARLFDSRLGRKQLLINGVKLKSRAELSGKMGAVLFYPDHINLFRGPSAARRRFLDSAIAQLSPAYAAAAERYGELLKSKNRILKDKDTRSDLLRVLEDYNVAMAKEGSLIIALRDSYVKKLENAARPIHSEISSGKEELSIKYSSLSNLPDPGQGRESIYIAMREHQKSHERAELEAGTCLSGPHKDDFELSLNGLEVKAFGSQGQNRSAVVSVKLAEREILTEDLGEYPLLLLDDVLSELDEGRQGFILSKIQHGQVFVTCCNQDGAGRLRGGRLLTIAGGALV